MNARTIGFVILATFPAAPQHLAAQRQPTTEWSSYGGDASGIRYSSAAQINRENVTRLAPAWTFRTGDMHPRGGRLQVTPLVVGGTMYVATPMGAIIALDPVTGTERWRFSTAVDTAGRYGDWASRGVSYWRSSTRNDATCNTRIVFANVEARLWAVDAATGRPCQDFGESGVVDLTRGLRNRPDYKGEYMVTSPPVIVGDLAVVGSAVADNRRVNGPSGVVRAYNVRTGALHWSWDPHPPRGTAGSETWQGPIAETTGAANAWAPLSADAARDLVFVPTGSPSPDYYGGERRGANVHANSLVALRASTGSVVWHFQMVHHDLWDYDLAAQPVQFTLRRGGRAIPAIAQATKMGLIFILDRETGAPFFPVRERAVPRSTVTGETASPTQPFPELPLPLVPHRFTAAEAWGVTEEDRAACAAKLAGRREDGIYTPPSLEGTIVTPGNVGGSNWSGVTIDTVRGLLIGNTNRLPALIQLVKREDAAARRSAAGSAEFAHQQGTPYAMLRELLLGPGGLPCNPPPWGALTAIDLSTGATKWEVPLGIMPQLIGRPEARQWGSINMGGAITTAGGLVFIAGTLDQRLRAFDSETGRELWSAELPAAGMATPMTYVGSDGRQYVVIASGGHDRLPIKRSDHIMAFALPPASR
jgi:quinoprotein glucose dehydrogenase